MLICIATMRIQLISDKCTAALYYKYQPVSLTDLSSLAGTVNQNNNGSYWYYHNKACQLIVCFSQTMMSILKKKIQCLLRPRVPIDKHSSRYVDKKKYPLVRTHVPSTTPGTHVPSATPGMCTHIYPWLTDC